MCNQVLVLMVEMAAGRRRAGAGQPGAPPSASVVMLQPCQRARRARSKQPAAPRPRQRHPNTGALTLTPTLTLTLTLTLEDLVLAKPCEYYMVQANT